MPWDVTTVAVPWGRKGKQILAIFQGLELKAIRVFKLWKQIKETI